MRMQISRRYASFGARSTTTSVDTRRVRPHNVAVTTDRPPFAERYPREPALDELVRSFEAGDYARVREDAAKLAASTDDAAVRASALDLRSRIEADPIAKGLLVFTGVLLAALTVWWVVHAHTPPSNAPRAPVVEHVH
jgi:hypothetical protein